jgi:SAM-dependent methyltransferase
VTTETARGTDLDTLAVDTVRTLAMDAIQKAGDGHPGTAMALGPAAYVLWTRFLTYDPDHPDWFDRDRFVLSNGHASVLQYIALHLTGYAIGIDMTPAMIERAKCAALKTGVWQNVEIRRGMAEELSVQSGTIDLVISNGMVNLSCDKRRVFSEIYRVLRPGGRLYLADVVVQRELSLRARSDINLWVA